MLIALIGENFSGKSTMVERLQTQRQATVFVGKDYLRMAKKRKRGGRVISAAFGDYQRALCSKDAWALA